MLKRILLAVSVFFSSIAFAQKKKPNVLFIFADDMTIKGLSSTSDGEVQTPNLDRLRRQGVFFTNTFNQGGFNGAISVASRAMINTGMNLWSAMNATNGNSGKDKYDWPEGVTPYVAQKPAERPTVWSEYMSDEGYETYISGKWHVPIAATEVFDHVKHIRAGMPNQAQDCYDRKFIKEDPDKWTPADTTYGGFWKGGKHWSEVLRDDAYEFLDISKESDKPFFMYLGFNAPHDPHQAPQEYQDMYPPESIKVPENFVSLYPYCEEVSSGRGLRDEWLAPFPRTEYSVQVNRSEYYALISHLDTQIGLILDKLEATGQAENTYILFTADHGIAIGDHGFLGKQNMYESSVRVPMIVAGPGIKGGKNVDDLVYLQDVMATALDIAGSDAVNKVDFKSLMPYVEGEKVDSRKYVIGCYIGCQRMVRDDRYKMIIYPNVNVVRLYDLKKDPMEINDLASNKKYHKMMDEMLVELQSIQKEIEDPLDVTKYYDNFMATCR